MTKIGSNPKQGSSAGPSLPELPKPYEGVLGRWARREIHTNRASSWSFWEALFSRPLNHLWPLAVLLE